MSSMAREEFIERLVALVGVVKPTWDEDTLRVFISLRYNGLRIAYERRANMFLLRDTVVGMANRSEWFQQLQPRQDL